LMGESILLLDDSSVCLCWDDGLHMVRDHELSVALA
jgi:hypothetical protein